MGPDAGRTESAADAQWTADSVSAITRGVFDPAAAFSLSAGSADAAPLPSWQKDHWNVIWWTGGREGDQNPPFTLAKVYPEGRLEKKQISTPAAPYRTYEFAGDDATVARLSQHDGTHCVLSVSNLDTGLSNTLFPFECMTATYATATPIPGSDAWLVAWLARSPVPEEAQLLVARYDPRRASWSAGPFVIASMPPYGYVPALAALKGDAWVWQLGFVTGTPQDLYQVHGLADPDGARPSSALTSIDITVVPSNGRRVQEVHEVARGAVAIDQDVTRARVFTINEGLASASTPLAESQRLTAISLPERNQIALCSTEGQVSLLLLDERGTPIGAPLLIDDSAMPMNCHLAWSGQELLVAWSMQANSGPISSWAEVNLFARILTLPDPSP